MISFCYIEVAEFVELGAVDLGILEVLSSSPYTEVDEIFRSKKRSGMETGS